VTLVIGAGGPSSSRANEIEALAAVADLVDAGIPRRRATDVVARLTGLPRNRLYRDSLS
jgi:hypothetical protein